MGYSKQGKTLFILNCRLKTHFLCENSGWLNVGLRQYLSENMEQVTEYSVHCGGYLRWGTTQKLGWKLIAIPTPKSFSQFRGKGLMLPVVFGSHENNSKKLKTMFTHKRDKVTFG